MLHCDICTKTNNHCCKADLNSSFDTFQTLYTELNDNVFKISNEFDMLVQEDCIYSLI